MTRETRTFVLELLDMDRERALKTARERGIDARPFLERHGRARAAIERGDFVGEPVEVLEMVQTHLERAGLAAILADPAAEVVERGRVGRAVLRPAKVPALPPGRPPGGKTVLAVLAAAAELGVLDKLRATVPGWSSVEGKR